MSERSETGRSTEQAPAARPLEAGDIPSVLALIDACYREFGLVLNLDDECESHLLDPGPYFRGHGGEFWVVPHHRRVMATAALVVHRDRPSPTGELKSMYVDQSWRRRGLGRRLVQMVIEAAQAAGCQELELWSDTRFSPAHAMYESLGFERVGHRELADSNNSSEYGYRRRI
jgi:putative acetyltransferase